MVMASDFANTYSFVLSKDFIRENPNYSAFFTALFQFMTDKGETDDNYGFSIVDILNQCPGFEGFLASGKFQPILECALDYGFIVNVEDEPGKYCFDFDIELGNQFVVMTYEQFYAFFSNFFEEQDSFDYKMVEYMFRCYATIVKYHNYFQKKLHTSYEFSITRLLGKACVPISKKNREHCLSLLKYLQEEKILYCHQKKESGLYVVDEI